MGHSNKVLCWDDIPHHIALLIASNEFQQLEHMSNNKLGLILLGTVQ